MRTYKVEVGNVTRELPVVEVSPGVSVALFNMLGDTEVTEAAGRTCVVTGTIATTADPERTLVEARGVFVMPKTSWRRIESTGGPSAS